MGLLSAVTSCGLHTTSLNAVEGESGGETGKNICLNIYKIISLLSFPEKKSHLRI